ncbi:hypothetical protein [Spirosoma endophyticum]|uniref:Uncharacterized protein n=1 Tax=Spirosoma endophyticum TaxID=662367 RepID=A0A1I1WC83_9BACT|nr:hypothetical protein [Spirosoma endophyticum]SFD91998.1 hypothetical protein SAMN05216167_108197 [Spirosoma endophyticum]
MMEPEIPLEQINAMMSSEGLTNHHVEFYLFTITGYLYDVAQAAARKWGDEASLVEHGIFYQITPNTDDDGFFTWYCEVRPYHQFFKTVDSAVLHFVFYWTLWDKDFRNE